MADDALTWVLQVWPLVTGASPGQQAPSRSAHSKTTANHPTADKPADNNQGDLHGF